MGYNWGAAGAGPGGYGGEMITIKDINARRIQNQQTPLRNYYEAVAYSQQYKEQTGKYEPLRNDDRKIHQIEDVIKSFCNSPKSKGNRQHLEMVLSTMLTAEEAQFWAWEGIQ